MKFAKFLKTPSFTKHLRWILLSNPKSNVKLWKILRYYGNSRNNVIRCFRNTLLRKHPFGCPSDDGETSLTNPPRTKFFEKLKWRTSHIFAVRWQHSCITLVVLTYDQCKVANSSNSKIFYFQNLKSTSLLFSKTTIWWQKIFQFEFTDEQEELVFVALK